MLNPLRKIREAITDISTRVTNLSISWTTKWEYIERRLSNISSELTIASKQSAGMAQSIKFQREDLDRSLHNAIDLHARIISLERFLDLKYEENTPAYHKRIGKGR